MRNFSYIYVFEIQIMSTEVIQSVENQVPLFKCFKKTYTNTILISVLEFFGFQLEKDTSTD